MNRKRWWEIACVLSILAGVAVPLCRTLYGQHLDKSLVLALDTHEDVTVERLIRAGANVNAHTELGETALHRASLLGKVDLVGVLLRKGARPDVVTRGGWTALMSASDGGHAKVARMLLAQRADPGIRNQLGQTALTHAVNGGHGPVVRVLIEAGADINGKDASGTSLLTLARKRGHGDIARSLRRPRVPHVLAPANPFHVSRRLSPDEGSPIARGRAGGVYEFEAASFSPDGKFLAAIGHGATRTDLWVWDTATWAAMHRLRDVSAIAGWTPDSERLCVQLGGAIVLIDAESGRERRVITASEPSDMPSRPFLSKDGRSLARLTRRLHPPQVEVWSVPRGQLLGRVGEADSIYGWSPESDRVAGTLAGGRGPGPVWIAGLDAAGRRRYHEFPTEVRRGMRTACLGAERRRIWIAYWDGPIRLWDYPPEDRNVSIQADGSTEGWKLMQSISSGGTPAARLSVSPSGKYLAIFRRLDSIELWSVHTEALVQTIATDSYPTAVSFTVDESRLAVPNAGFIDILEARTPRCEALKIPRGSSAQRRGWSSSARLSASVDWSEGCS